MNNQLVIGIGGISQSGKSTLTRELKKKLSSQGLSVKVFEIDHYTIEKDQIPSIKDRLDWEHPESIDWERLVTQIQKATADVVLIEGIFAFDTRLVSFYSKKILIEVDHSTFMERRKKEIRWGEEPLWYLDHVWETNQQLIKSAAPDLRFTHDQLDMPEQAMKLIQPALK